MLRLLRLLAPLILACGLMASTTSEVALTAPGEDPKTKAAQEAMSRLETRLGALRDLEAEERQRRGGGLEGVLEDLVERCAGTRFENKALYYFADWRWAYRDGEGAEPLIERIRRSGKPSYQQLATLLLARIRLRQGKPQEARTLIGSVSDKIPEFTPFLALVGLHERVGSALPAVPAGTPNLGGGPADPFTIREEPWLVVVCCRLAEPVEAALLAGFLRELQDREYTNRIRLVTISFDGNAVVALNRLSEITGAAGLDVLWANPNEGGSAKVWRETWRLPEPPVVLLLGPKPGRNLLAVDPTPDDLRPLVGLKKTLRRSGSGAGWGGIRGRKDD